MLRNVTSIAIVLSISIIARAESLPLVIHEWGTFTSLQDEKGNALPGISEDVEPLPSFVQNFQLLDSGKGISPLTSPQITMRLETPVVYFHLPRGAAPMKLSFSATFLGGVLSQWYPRAENSMSPNSMPVITEKTRNKLTWDDVTIGKPATSEFPQTISPIWLAPRKVDASDVIASNGQAERYLFYRGVGHLDAPLRVSRIGSDLRITPQLAPELGIGNTMSMGPMWYLDVKANGAVAYRRIETSSTATAALTRAAFDGSQYSTQNLAKLRGEMKTSLISAGLFDDEADAMLNTWESAYFKSAGSRLMFLVPSAWTEHHLKLDYSVSAEIERVMVGRIDLVTPRQRELARAALRLPTNDPGLTSVRAQIGRFAAPIIAEEKAHPTLASPLTPVSLRP